MQTYTVEQRQQIGCGFEPLVQLRSQWTPPSSRLGFEGIDYKGSDPTMCPGYTTSLPEVREVANAHGWRELGELRSFCGGKPTEQLVEGVGILAREVVRYQNWASTPTSEGGGREVKR